VYLLPQSELPPFATVTFPVSRLGQSAPLVVVRSQPHWFFSRPNLRLYQTLKRAKAVPPGGRSQWHHPHPEHCLVADIDIVLARECQLAVIANTEHRQACGYWIYRIAIPHIHR
jgi:hypothetical protein